MSIYMYLYLLLLQTTYTIHEQNHRSREIGYSIIIHSHINDGIIIIYTPLHESAVLFELQFLWNTVVKCLSCSW